MKKYTRTDISEQELEDLVRRGPELIEEGLVYVDHQKPAAGGRLDVLLVDSGRSLVVAELKVVQDDGMLIQGLDYYDYVSAHVEAFARLYKTHSIDPTQQVRLLLIAPTFSQNLVNRCKWLNLRVSLFTFNCLKFEGEADVVPVFIEQEVTPPPEPIDVPHLEDSLNYITDVAVRAKVSGLLDEIRNWKTGNISVDPLKYGISMKVNGHVFAYFYPRRKHYIIGTYDANNDWKDYAVKTDDDLITLKPIVKAAMERRGES
jgi:Endonuclease NucS